MVRKNAESWKKVKKYGPSDVYISRCENVGLGLIQFTCFSRDCDNASLLGLVIVRNIHWFAKHCQVVHSYVDPVCRRKGIRTLLQSEILKEFNIVTTMIGTKDGEAWMRNAGYVYDAAYGHWVYRKK